MILIYRNIKLFKYYTVLNTHNPYKYLMWTMIQIPIELHGLLMIISAVESRLFTYNMRALSY